MSRREPAGLLERPRMSKEPSQDPRGIPRLPVTPLRPRFADRHARPPAPAIAVHAGAQRNPRKHHHLAGCLGGTVRTRCESRGRCVGYDRRSESGL